MQLHFFIYVLAAVLSTLATYWLNHRLNQGPVRASALLSLVVGGFFYFFPNLFEPLYSRYLPLYIVGGSFIGMITSTIGISYFSLLLSPVLFAFLMHFMARSFEGFGGSIGATACIALMSTMAFPLITKNQKVTYGYRLIRVLLYKRSRRLRKSSDT